MRATTAVTSTAIAGALLVALLGGCGSTREAGEVIPAAPGASPTSAAATATTVSPRTLPAETVPRRTRPRRTAPAETVPPTTAPPTTVAPTTTVLTVAPTEAAAVEAPAEASNGLGSIEIPSIGVTRTMYEGIEMSTLDYGPGHWPGTAMPGEAGNVVVAGHRVSHNADFRNLDALSPGAEVIFNTGSGRHVYAVVSTEIVQPDATWIVDQTSDATATLFACHPPGSISQRIVVHLQLVG